MNKVFYSQEDSRWRQTMYSNHGDRTQTIGTSGCGPTSAAMAISSLTERDVLPTIAASHAIAKGYRTYNDGTAWGFFGSIAKEYGVECKQTGNLKEVKEALAAGGLVVASMRPGHFTGGGHFILLVGVSQNGRTTWIDVFDPNHDNLKYGNDGLINQGIRNDGKVTAKECVFQKEAGQYWIYSIKEEEIMLKSEDANKVIRFLSAAYAATQDLEARKEYNRLANELRKASGQPVQ